MSIFVVFSQKEYPCIVWLFSAGHDGSLTLTLTELAVIFRWDISVVLESNIPTTNTIYEFSGYFFRLFD